MLVYSTSGETFLIPISFYSKGGSVSSPLKSCGRLFLTVFQCFGEIEQNGQNKIVERSMLAVCFLFQFQFQIIWKFQRSSVLLRHKNHLF